MIEGSFVGAVSVPRTNGPDPGVPKTYIDSIYGKGGEMEGLKKLKFHTLSL